MTRRLRTLVSALLHRWANRITPSYKVPIERLTSDDIHRSMQDHYGDAWADRVSRKVDTYARTVGGRESPGYVGGYTSTRHVDELDPPPRGPAPGGRRNGGQVN